MNSPANTDESYQNYVPYHHEPSEYTFQQAVALRRLLDVDFKVLRPFTAGTADPEPEYGDLDDMVARALTHTEKDRDHYRNIFEHSGFTTTNDIGREGLFPKSPFFIKVLDSPLNYDYTSELIKEIETIAAGDDVSIITTGPPGDIRRTGFVGYVSNDVVNVQVQTIRRGTGYPVESYHATYHVEITRDLDGTPVELHLTYPDRTREYEMNEYIEEFWKIN